MSDVVNKPQFRKPSKKQRRRAAAQKAKETRKRNKENDQKEKDDNKSKWWIVEAQAATGFATLLTRDIGISLKIPSFEPDKKEFIREALKDYLGDTKVVDGGIDSIQSDLLRAWGVEPFLKFVTERIETRYGNTPKIYEFRDAWDRTGLEAALTWCHHCWKIRQIVNDSDDDD